MIANLTPVPYSLNIAGDYEIFQFVYSFVQYVNSYALQAATTSEAYIISIKLQNLNTARKH